ncbi:MAG: aldehyde dehydrogenase (NADP(+)) [Planctomycetota bacterium]
MTSAPTAEPPARRKGPTGWSILEGQTEEAPQVQPFKAIDPSRGEPLPIGYHSATPEQVDRACRAAWVALHEVRRRSPEHRAGLLEAIAANILELGPSLINVAAQETGLPEQRLLAERERTTGTLLRFAEVVREGSWVRAAIDRADPERQPRPKPDVRRVLRSLGPVAVFGASNFPLAYSTMGTDAASALAAGCPVIIKGHPLHPGTGELVAWAVVDALQATGFPQGMFAFLHAGGQREKAIGEELVKHPFVRAAGFTGSQAGGTALADLARARPDPIPFFAEMGSTNPAFLLPSAAASQGEAVAHLLTESITAFAGQQCTRPGLLFMIDNEDASKVLNELTRRFNTLPDQVMLAPRIRDAYLRRVLGWAGVEGVELKTDPKRLATPRAKDGSAPKGPVSGAAALLRTTSSTFLSNDTLHDEVFGPAVLVVLCPDERAMANAAASIQGTLTASMFFAADDRNTARRLVSVLEHRAGRIVFNGVPTGVEVCEAMVHGGPFPATNRPDTTAVGPLALERWCRPVAYQNGPGALLPPELRDDNPAGIRRRVDGKWRSGPLSDDEA